jgi:hypothetical protein
MKQTLILVTTHRGLSDETYECILKTGCTSICKVKGQACIDRARSIAFDQAFEAFRMEPSLDVLLCIDDDMVFEPRDAQRLVEIARQTQMPVAARAVNSHGELAARRYERERLIIGSGAYAEFWVTGLAFIAIPKMHFVELGKTLPKLGGIREWCHTGRHPGFPDQWIGEDYWFCAALGGVLLAPFGVGHLKPAVLWPKPAVEYDPRSRKAP